jgi:putative membrane protein
VFLGLLTEICYGIFYTLSFGLAGIWPPAENLVFVGFGFAFVLWYFLLLLAFDFRKSAFLLATMQLVFFAVFLLAGGRLGAEADLAGLLVKIYLAAFVFLAALYVMFYLISAPMKKNLRISSMDALSMFLSQWLYGEKDLEGAFEEIGEEMETLAWVGKFSGRKNEALFVVPYIHYGPFGNLGGSDFTWQIADALSGKKREVFVFHGTATHDFNPVASREIGKVVGACQRALQKLKTAPASLSVSSCKVGSVRACAMRINDSAFLSYSRAPLTTEDVSLGLGLAIMEKARKYCSSAAVVDEHNAETGDISSVEVGSPIGFEMLDAAEGVLSGKPGQKPFLFGCASGKISLETVGKNGLKMALFSQGKGLHAIVLADANGIVPSFRLEIIDLLAHLGKECGCACQGEIMTTDTHQINTVQGVLNPLGSEQRGDVMELVRRLFYEARRNLEPVKFGACEERFGIKVFGSGQSAEIASTINAVVAILRLALPMILVASALVLLWALGKI